MPHEIRIIRERKKDFLELLLLADEQENMIDLYLDRGELFALYDGGLKSVCVVTEENIRYLRIEEPRHTARIPETGIRTGTDTPHLAILPRTLPDHARRYGRNARHTLLLRIVRIRPLAPYTGFFHRPLPPFDRRRGNHA